MTPKIMLFDEPTSALDPEAVGEVLDVMVMLAESGMTLLCVTHEGLARKSPGVLFLDGGRIIEDQPPEAFFTAPRTPRAQAFLAQVLGRRLVSSRQKSHSSASNAFLPHSAYSAICNLRDSV